MKGTTLLTFGIGKMQMTPHDDVFNVRATHINAPILT